MPNRAIVLAAATAAALAVLPVVMLLAGALSWGYDFADIGSEHWGSIAMNTLVLAIICISVLGWPAYFILDHFNLANWRSLSLAGFTLAAVAATFFLWVARSFIGSHSEGMYHGRQVAFIIDGRLTYYGWLQYAETTTLIGLHGVAAALAFHYVWRRLSIEANVQA